MANNSKLHAAKTAKNDEFYKITARKMRGLQPRIASQPFP